VGEHEVPLPYIYSFSHKGRVRLRLIDFALFLLSTIVITFGMTYSNYIEAWLFIAAGLTLFAFSMISVLISIFGLSGIRLPKVW
jgi:hypothetical protein